MKKIKSIILLLVSIIFLLALKWPVKKILLTATFGESRSDHFHNGIDLGKKDQKIYPIKKGKIIYYYDESEHPLLKGYGNGNIVILQHQKKSRSYYYHIKKGTIEKNKIIVNTNDIIGVTGNSGRSFGPHLHLTYKKNKNIINPLKFMPKINDKRSPKITSIYFLINNRLITVKKNMKLNGIDSFELMAKIYDTYKKIEKIAVLGIYKVAFYIDDRLAKTYTFDHLINKKGHQTLSNGDKFENIYYKESIYRGGKYKNMHGLHSIKVKAWDYYGNVSTKNVSVIFR